MTDINVEAWVTTVTSGQMGRPLPPPETPSHIWHVDRNMLYMRAGPIHNRYDKVAAVVQDANADWIVLVKSFSGPTGWAWPVPMLIVPLLPEAGVWLPGDDLHFTQIKILDSLIETAVLDLLKHRRKHEKYWDLQRHEREMLSKYIDNHNEYAKHFALKRVEPIRFEDVELDVEMRHKRYREKWNSPSEVAKRKRQDARRMMNELTGGKKKK